MSESMQNLRLFSVLRASVLLPACLLVVCAATGLV